MRRTIMMILICLLFLGLSYESRAEVSVRTDRNGNYLKTQIIPIGPHAEHRAWGLRGRGFRRGNTLNPYGDINGDLWPTIAEAQVSPHHPIVIWSRFNGSNYDMAWSRWSSNGWQEVEYVSSQPMPGDDLDGVIAFDSQGRPCIAWWSRLEEGGGRVYFSIYLANRWLPPILISDPTVDSRRPTLDVRTARETAVSYETPEGRVTQFITFASPNTITDDINPQSRIIVDVPTSDVGMGN